MPKFNKPAPPPTHQGQKPSRPTKIPLIVEQKCLVCKSVHRHLVDQMLVAGLSFSEIERQFEFAGLKRRSIANHKDKHLGYEEAAIREVIEREATNAQRNFEEGKSRLITKNAYLEVALQKAYDALIKDMTVVEPKDAVKVIEMLQRMQDSHHDVMIDELRIQFQMFMQSVKELVEREKWESIVGRTADLLRSSGYTIDFEEEKQIEAGEIVEAEVVKV